jgi:HEAT repeat protein
VEVRIGSQKYKFPKAVVKKVEQAWDNQSERRVKAMEELSRMGTNAWPVVPVLVGFLYDKDMQCSFSAATVLARINAQSHPEWPELEKRLRGRSQAVLTLRYLIFGKDIYGRPGDAAQRRFAMIGLAAIGPKAASAYPELIEVVKYGEDHELRGVALNAAARIDTAKTLPLLKEILKNRAEWPQVSAAAALALADTAPEAPETRGLLENALDDSRSLARLGAARALWRLKAPSDQVLPVMTALLSHKLTSIRKAALEAIAEMGGAARQSRSEIERLTADENEGIRRSAASVLRNIEGRSSS